MDREEWNERYRADGLLWKADPNRFLVEEVDGLPPGRALDLATGEGRNAVWLAERGWQVTGVDFSDVALAKARELAASRGVGITLREADLTTYDPERAAYDLVIVLYLQLPADLRRPIMRRAADAVAPGGTLLVVGHHLANLTEGIGGPGDPAVLYTPRDIVADMSGSGLVIEKAQPVARPVEIADGHKDAIDVLVRAVRPAG